VGDVPYLVLFLKTDQAEQGLRWVLDIIEHEIILENDLRRGVVVAVERNGEKVVVYPEDFQGSFLA
jgi:hypothetical protein